MLLFSLLFTAAAPAVAFADTDSDGGVNEFIGTVERWGEFLARLTGDYGVIEKIVEFAALVKSFDFIVRGGDGIWDSMRSLLRRLGIDFSGGDKDEDEPALPAPNKDAPGSYSI